MHTLDGLIGSITKVMADKWEAFFPGEPEPHSIHFDQEIKFTFEFWEEPSEEVRKVLRDSKIAYFVTKRIGKIVMKPIT